MLLGRIWNWMRGHKDELMSVPSLPAATIEKFDHEVARSQVQRRNIEHYLSGGPHDATGIVVADSVGGRGYRRDERRP